MWSEALLQLAAGEDGGPEDEGQRPTAQPPADPLRFDEAVSAFRARVPMSDAAFRALREAVHSRAFVIAGVTKLDLVAEVWNALDDAVANGTTFAQFQKEVGAKLEAEWGRANPSRLETIFRTNVQRSYSAGTLDMMREPAVLKRRPYWKFSAILDGRTTQVCAECHGTVLPADHPFWATRQPPLHFNCRSHLIPLTVAQADSTGVTDETPAAEPMKGFGNLEEDWKPDLTKYPAGLAHEFVRKTQS